MNRRSMLKTMSGAAAAGFVASLPLKSLASSLKLHPAIQANIDYWMKAAPDWLAECPPYHTSYYAVKERGELRVYAVDWHGSDLNNHALSTPSNEAQLVAEVQRQINETNRLLRGTGNMDIGGVIDFEAKPQRSFCSYVFDSPVRRSKHWLGSLATSLINEGCFYRWDAYEERRRREDEERPI